MTSSPEELRGTVIAHLSPYFTMAVICDAGGDHALAASMAEAAILAMADRYSSSTR